MKRAAAALRSIGICRCSVLIAAIGLGAASSRADSDSATETFRVNGFGTVGISQLDTPDNWGYRRDISQADNDSATRGDLDSRIGVQLNYTPNAEFELVGQAAFSRRVAASNDGDRIALAFAAYSPDANWIIRVGRVNFDAYLLSDHRDVGFAYEFARPPVEFYAQLPTYLNGADASRVWNDSGTLWRVKGMAGTTVIASDSVRIGIRSVFGMVLSRQTAGLLIRASVIRGRLENSPAALTPLTDALEQISALPVADVAAQASAFHSELGFRESSSYLALGAEYEHGDWLWSSEVTRVTGVRGFDAGYGSVGRRFGPVSVYGILSAISSVQRVASTPDWGSELSPVIGPAAAEQAQELATSAAIAINSLSARQHTVSFGARWNIAAQLAVKAQWDHIRVNADGTELWANATLEAAKANVYSVVLDFVF